MDIYAVLICSRASFLPGASLRSFSAFSRSFGTSFKTSGSKKRCGDSTQYSRSDVRIIPASPLLGARVLQVQRVLPRAQAQQQLVWQALRVLLRAQQQLV